MPYEARDYSGLRGFRAGTPGAEGYSSMLSGGGQVAPRASVFHQPGVDGYGDTYGGYRQAMEDAAERDRQDVSDLRNTIGLMNDIRTYNQTVALDPLQVQEAQEQLSTAKMVRQEAELKMQDIMARRKRREAVIDSAEFMGIKEALDNGVVDQDTLGEMNAVRQEAGLPLVSAMGYDPETGKIMVFDEEGSPYEYDRVGTLATFLDAYPDYEPLAETILPGDVAQQRSARMQALLQAQKSAQEEERYRQRMIDERIDRIARFYDRQIDRLAQRQKTLTDMNPVEGDAEYEELQGIGAEIDRLNGEIAKLYGLGGQDDGDAPAQVPQVSVAQPQGGQAVDWKQLQASGQK